MTRAAKGPTWTEHAQAIRDLELSKAMALVLRKEVRAAHAQVEELKGEVGEAGVLEEENDELKAEIRKLQGEVAALNLRARNLEWENGQVEARLARALGRVIVVAKEDEVVALATALDSIVKFCTAELGEDLPAGIDTRGSGNPAHARLRQIKACAQYAMKQAGAAEKSAKEVRELQEKAKGDKPS